MNRIKDLRLERNMRQADLAILLNTKPQTVSHYEKGDRGLDVETILHLCDIFGCTSDYLLCRSSSPSAAMTDEEAALLRAYRAADDRARAVVDLTLEPFKDQRAGNPVKKSTAAG